MNSRPASRLLVPVAAGVILALFSPFRLTEIRYYLAASMLLCAGCATIVLLKGRRASHLVFALLMLGGITLMSSVDGTVSPYRRTPSAVRESLLMEKIDHLWDETEAALFRGILCGDTRGMNKDAKHSFQRAGLAHLLAVSGLHVGIVSRMICRLSLSLSSSRRYGYAALLMLLPVYTLLVGWKVSAVRAAVMGILAASGMLFSQRGEAINSLCIAGLFILYIDPCAISSASFQLSFMATLGILTSCASPGESTTQREGTLMKIIKDTLRTSVVAQIWVLPLAGFYFKSIPLIAPISNVLALPLICLLVPAGYLCVIGSLLAPWIAPCAARCLALPARGLLCLARCIGECSFAAVQVPHFNLVWVGVGYTLIAGMILRQKTVSRICSWGYLLFLGTVLFLL